MSEVECELGVTKVVWDKSEKKVYVIINPLFHETGYKRFLEIKQEYSDWDIILLNVGVDIEAEWADILLDRCYEHS